MKLLLRLFADCDEDATAANLQIRLEKTLEVVHVKSTSKPKRYWKLPHLFEFTFDLAEATVGDFEKVISMVSGGWSTAVSTSAETFSVWNRAEGLAFLIPEVSWAHLELFEAEG